MERQGCSEAKAAARPARRWQVSMSGQCPGSPGESEQWLARFDMFDWVGGRTASQALSGAARRF